MIKKIYIVNCQAEVLFKLNKSLQIFQLKTQKLIKRINLYSPFQNQNKRIL